MNYAVYQTVRSAVDAKRRAELDKETVERLLELIVTLEGADLPPAVSAQLSPLIDFLGACLPEVLASRVGHGDQAHTSEGLGCTCRE